MKGLRLCNVLISVLLSLFLPCVLKLWTITSNKRSLLMTFLQTGGPTVFVAFYNLWQHLMKYHHWAFPKTILWKFTEGSQRTFLQKPLPLYCEYQQFTKILGIVRKSLLKLHRMLQDLPPIESSVFICYQVWNECHWKSYCLIAKCVELSTLCALYLNLVT